MWACECDKWYRSWLVITFFGRRTVLLFIRKNGREQCTGSRWINPSGLISCLHTCFSLWDFSIWIKGWREQSHLLQQPKIGFLALKQVVLLIWAGQCESEEFKHRRYVMFCVSHVSDKKKSLSFLYLQVKKRNLKPSAGGDEERFKGKGGRLMAYVKRESGILRKNTSEPFHHPDSVHFS